MTNHRPEAGPGLKGLDAPPPRQTDRQIVTRVLSQVRLRLRARSLSPRTEKRYLGWIECYLGYHGRRDPAEMGRPEIEGFLGHLASELDLAPPSLNQATAAVLFLSREVHGKDYGGRGGVAREKPSNRLPR